MTGARMGPGSPAVIAAEERVRATAAELGEALVELVHASAAERARGPVQLLSVAEAAKRLGVSRTSAYQLIGSGRLRSITVGRRRLVPASELERIAREGLQDGA